MTLTELQHELDTRDDGVLKHGKHKPGREFCALEFESQVRKREWSDTPLTLPDLRPLNDGLWSSNAARTKALLPVMVALWEWASWSPKRRQQWASRVAILTIQRIIAELPTLPPLVRLQCQNAQTCQEAQAAAEAAAGAAGATWAATRATNHDPILERACTIWIESCGEPIVANGGE